MKEGHSIAHKLGYEYSVVLGHSKYYPKAGYIPASECGIKAPLKLTMKVLWHLILTEVKTN